MNATAKPLFPLKIREDRVIRDLDDLASLIVAESDKQVEERLIRGPEGFERAISDDERDEFRLACDGLNWWRVRWRCCEELHVDSADIVDRELVARICEIRSYDPDEFQSAIAATRGRARAPYGLSPLELAYAQANRQPIRLIAPQLANASLPSLIAAIAMHLQSQRPEGRIVLPIESIRTLVKQRKLVVGGAVRRLIEHGLIKEVGDKYHTGHAREFQFVGEAGKDYELLPESKEEKEKEVAGEV